MLSIAQTDNGYYCFEWFPTEKGPRVDNYLLIKDKNCCFNNDFEKPLAAFPIKNKQHSQSLAFILNSDNVNFNSILVDKNFEIQQSIDWYEKNILDENYLKNYDLFYYPIISDENSQSLLVISILKELKNKIKLLAEKYSYNIIYLSVDIFSVYVMVKQVYKISNRKKCLIWKIKKNNYHCFTFYEDDCLSAVVIARCSNSQYKISKKIGTDKSVDFIEDFIKQTVIKKQSFDKIDEVYVYQTKMNESLLKKYTENKKINVKLLDISKIFNCKNKNSYKFLPYAENGISLRGVDV